MSIIDPTDGLGPGPREGAGARGSLAFVGTATAILRLGSFTLLTDPNFLHRGQRAYLGKGLWSKRLTEPALRVDQLPVLDAVVLSHLHGDHFDRVARRSLDRRPPVLTTPAASRRLRTWGFDAVGLSTWETLELVRGAERLTVHALPGIHGRGVMRPLLPPVMGSLLNYAGMGERRRNYITGDTLTGPHLDAIAERFAPVDAIIAHLGGTRVLFHTVTMDASQGLDLLHRMPARRVLAVHHDDYGVFRSPIAAFVDVVARSGLTTEVTVPARGETVNLW